VSPPDWQRAWAPLPAPVRWRLVGSKLHSSAESVPHVAGLAFLHRWPGRKPASQAKIAVVFYSLAASIPSTGSVGREGQPGSLPRVPIQEIVPIKLGFGEDFLAWCVFGHDGFESLDQLMHVLGLDQHGKLVEPLTKLLHIGLPAIEHPDLGV